MFNKNCEANCPSGPGNLSFINDGNAVAPGESAAITRHFYVLLFSVLVGIEIGLSSINLAC